MNKLLKLSILTLALNSLNMQAKRYWFDTDFFQDLHNMHEIIRQDMRELENYFNKYDFNNKLKTQEEQKAQEAQEKLESIKPEIKKSDNGDIEIIFSVKDIDKKSIEDITLQDNMLVGQLESDYGKISFYITDNGIKLVRKLELKDENNKNQKYIYSYGSSNFYSLPLSVDLSTADAQLKDDNLIINLKAKNYSKIKIKK